MGLRRIIAASSRALTGWASNAWPRKGLAVALEYLDDRHRVATAHGGFSVRVGNTLERWRADTLPTKEPETIAWLDETVGPDSVFWDVGANIGLYSLYALHRHPGVKAVCFEPEALNFARLNQNLHDNGCSGRAWPFAVGLGEAEAVIAFKLSRLQAGRALHGARHVAEAAHTQGLVIKTLDDMVFSTGDSAGWREDPGPARLAPPAGRGRASRARRGRPTPVGGRFPSDRPGRAGPGHGQFDLRQGGRAVTRTLAVIPARWTSSRFPGKPLAEIAGRPMIAHVWDRVAESPSVDAAVVATDDARIADYCVTAGMDVELTSADHETGTDRLAEVATRRAAEVYVNVQGDEPLIDPGTIDACAQCLHDARPRGIEVATAYLEGATDDQKASPSTVHLVPTLDGCVLTFPAWPCRWNSAPPSPIRCTSACTPSPARPWRAFPPGTAARSNGRRASS